MSQEKGKMACTNATMAVTPTPPDFFQVLLPGFHRELLIPLAFFTKYLGGDEACKEGVLRSSSGKPWPVKIKGRRIQTGWPEFAREHNLQIGYFLVLKHNGNFVFDVAVFDRSACNRPYPPPPHDNKVEEDIGLMKGERRPVKADPVKDFDGPKEISRKKQTRAPPKAEDANPQLEHPSFVGILKHLKYGTSKVYVRKKFVEANRLKDYHEELILRDERGRWWPEKLLHRVDRIEVYILLDSCGIQAANDLTIGDTLTFVLIEREPKPIFNVLRVKKSLANASPQISIQVKPRPKPAICSDHSFTSIIRPNSLKYELYVPANFARANGLLACYGATLYDQLGRLWHVGLRHNEARKFVFITTGWYQFAVGNGLTLGDWIKLELIKGGKNPIIKCRKVEPKKEVQVAKEEHFR